jgi:hypothetical protein
MRCVVPSQRRPLYPGIRKYEWPWLRDGSYRLHYEEAKAELKAEAEVG